MLQPEGNGGFRVGRSFQINFANTVCGQPLFAFREQRRSHVLSALAFQHIDGDDVSQADRDAP